MRKGEISCHKQFLLFSQCFVPCMVLIFYFKCTFKMLSAICFNLDQSKVLLSGNAKGRLPQKLQSKSTLSCKIVQIYIWFFHGFIKKPKSKFSRNRKYVFCSYVMDF